jgi:alpha-beta hydrolase superfamily lysophospholipase
MTYADAVAELRRIASDERNDPAIDPECRSIALLHGRRTPRAIVLWHGFTNCPRQFAELGRLFFERGYNVYIPLIPRHGRRDRMTDALEDLRAGELKMAAVAAARLALWLGESADTAGLSLGGVLAAWLAQQARIGTAMAIAPFFALPWFSHNVNLFVANLALQFPNQWLWWDPRLKEQTRPLHAYPRYPSHALATLMLFGESVFRLADRAAPLAERCVLVVNDKDPAVNNKVSDQLWTRWLQHGEMVQTYTFTDLAERHDIIEPATYPDAPRLVYPVLVDLILRADGAPLPIRSVSARSIPGSGPLQVSESSGPPPKTCSVSQSVRGNNSSMEKVERWLRRRR